MELIDVSVPIRSRMPVYEGNPGVHLERAQSIPDGEATNVSGLDLGMHTGTHVDAPLHFFDDGAGAESIDPAALLGEAIVVDATALTEDIDAAALDRVGLPADATRLLLKTPNSELWAREEFTRDFIRLVESGAQRLVDAGTRLIGIDYLSIGDEAAHRVLLRAGVVPLEGLDLRGVAPGRYRLVCTALPVVGSDGAPARALLSPL